LLKPPADTLVLLGYVKGPEHLEWVHRVGLYNLRGDERAGAVSIDSEAVRAEVLFLYGPTLGMHVETFLVTRYPRILTGDQLVSTGYPEPRGRLYICHEVTRVETPTWLDGSVVRGAIRRRRPAAILGEPVPMRLSDLLEVAIARPEPG
jgi:hypothetical protein